MYRDFVIEFGVCDICIFTGLWMLPPFPLHPTNPLGEILCNNDPPL